MCVCVCVSLSLSLLSYLYNFSSSYDAGPVCGGKHVCVFGAKCVRILQLDIKTQDVETTDNSDSHSSRLVKESL